MSNVFLGRLVFLMVIFGFVLNGKLSAQAAEFRYVAVGDSYTIGTGIDPQQAWPTLLTKHLQSQNIDIKLVANLARAGWTSQDVLTRQVPMLIPLKPNFVTILVGANDWVRGVDQETFTKQWAAILDQLQKILPGTAQILVLTIPDFSVTLSAKNFGSSLNVKRGISGFNAIITEEAQARGLKVIDLFNVSQKMGQDSSLVAEDGLHPSAKEHMIWEQQIYPTVLELLKHIHRTWTTK